MVVDQAGVGGLPDQLALEVVGAHGLIVGRLALAHGGGEAGQFGYVAADLSGQRWGVVVLVYGLGEQLVGSWGLL